MQCQNRTGVAARATGGACTAVVKVTWADAAPAGSAEWIAMQIWQCSACLLRGWSCATCNVAANTTSSPHKIAVSRNQLLDAPDTPDWKDLVNRNNSPMSGCSAGRVQMFKMQLAPHLISPRPTSKRRSMARFGFALLAILLFSALACPAQSKKAPLSKPTSTPNVSPANLPNQRLILKDGTYQIVKRYEIVGDRVRYISAERNTDWEEIPKDLVDWAATDKWAKDHSAAAEAAAVAAENSPDTQEAATIDKEEAAERTAEVARMPTVAPGLRLPDESGVWALDTFHDVPELVGVMQNTGDLARNTGHTIRKYTIGNMGGSKQLIQIEGSRSKVQFHVAKPILYISIDTDDPAPDSSSTIKINTGGLGSIKDKNSTSSPDSHYAIVRVQVSRNLRTIGAMRVSALGHVSQAEDIIDATTEVLPGKKWMRITPKYPLDFGEYALMEIINPKEVNLAVWDFGVDPTAPDNKGSLTPIRPGQP
jgi:hypothetical protein